MLNFIKRKLKALTTLYFYLLVIAVVAVSLLPWWPFFQGLTIPKYLLLFGPRWWLLLVSLLVFICWPVLSKQKKLLLPVLFIGGLNYLDFQLPALAHYFQFQHTAEDKSTIKIIQANIGGGGSIYEIQLLVENEQPDILLLQEVRNTNFSEWISPEYQTNCRGGLCILSKLTFEVTGQLSRNLIDGWGNFAMLYKIKTAQGDFSLANIHMETPRSVIMSFIHREWAQTAANKLEDNRQYESLLIASWVDAQEKVIIAGDFNMLEDENIYQKYFSSMNNALGNASFGLNYTKKTSWHGVRIDHLLFSNDFVLKDATVLNFITGDHRPVVSILSIK
jgi:exonuclease III